MNKQHKYYYTVDDPIDGDHRDWAYEIMSISFAEDDSDIEWIAEEAAEDDSDIEWIAEEAAEDYQSNHDGWERRDDTWNVFVYDSNYDLLGHCKVTREYEPTFSARRTP